LLCLNKAAPKGRLGRHVYAEAQVHMREAARIAESFDPVLYDLRYVDASSSDTP